MPKKRIAKTVIDLLKKNPELTDELGRIAKRLTGAATKTTPAKTTPAKLTSGQKR